MPLFLCVKGVCVTGCLRCGNVPLEAEVEVIDEMCVRQDLDMPDNCKPGSYIKIPALGTRTWGQGHSSAQRCKGVSLFVWHNESTHACDLI